MSLDAAARAQVFEALVSSSQDAIVSVDAAGMISTWNPGAQRLFGFSWHEAIGRPVAMLFPPPPSHSDRDALERVLAGRPVDRYETKWRSRSRELADVSVSFSPIRGGGDRIAGASVVVIDNSRGTAVLAAMAKSMRHLRKGFDNAPIGMALVRPDGMFVEVNDALCRLLGYGREQLLTTTFQMLTAPEDLPEELGYVDQVLTGRTHGYHLEKRFLSADRGPVWVLLSCSSVNATQPLPDYLLLQMEDITDRKAAEGFLMHRALHDPLTDLPNRVLLLDRLAQALAAVDRRETLVAVLYLDLDQFKVVNDTLGHEAGDVLLTMVAERLRAISRPSDAVARLGGDEFVMLCEGISRTDEVLAIAERVVHTLNAPVSLGERDVATPVSLGIAIAQSDADSPATLLSHADQALYRAKAGGGGRIEVYEERMQSHSALRVALADDLRRGMQAGELRVVYQMMVSLASGSLDGVGPLCGGSIRNGAGCSRVNSWAWPRRAV